MLFIEKVDPGQEELLRPDGMLGFFSSFFPRYSCLSRYWLAGGRQLVINVPDFLAQKMGTKQTDSTLDPDMDAPKPVAWGDSHAGGPGAGVNLKWEVVEGGCCMRVIWPEPKGVRHGEASL